MKLVFCRIPTKTHVNTDRNTGVDDRTRNVHLQIYTGTKKQVKT